MSFNREDTTHTKAPLCAVLRKPERHPRVPGLECPSGLSEVSDEEFDELIGTIQPSPLEVTILVRRTRGGLQQILEVFDSQSSAVSYIKDHFFDLWPEPLEVAQFCCCPEKIEVIRWAYAGQDVALLTKALGVPLSFFFSLVIREVRGLHSESHSFE